tara:strand:+ start:82 stop:588 length:507 start_codon:yes stop_codon:yes gene_type:complete
MTLHHPELYRTMEGVVAGIGVRSRAMHRSGDFVGFYTGRLMTTACYEASHDARLEDISFAIEGTDYVVVRSSYADVIGFINEVPNGFQSNVVAIPIHLDAGNAVGYFATQCIEPHTELLVHYGDSFERTYDVGTEAPVPKRLQRADSVLSNSAMHNTKLYCAPRRNIC